MSVPLIETVNLKKYFKTGKGMLHAVEEVNLKIEEGKTLGVVGESGCGKSTLGRTILRLHPATSGQVLFNGKDILKCNKINKPQGVVAHAFNPSTREVEAGGFLSSRPAWSTK